MLIRHQAAGRARNRQVTLSLLISGGGGWALGGAFLLLLPWISPKLLFIRENPWYALCFVAFCAFAAVNLLTDSVFMAARPGSAETSSVGSSPSPMCRGAAHSPRPVPQRTA